MKSMDKLDLLRTAAASGDPEQLAEAIVRTQEASDYVSREYLDARLGQLSAEIRDELRTSIGDVRTELHKAIGDARNTMLLAMLGAVGVILGAIYFVVPRLVTPGVAT
jgi:hypothetical protein